MRCRICDDDVTDPKQLSVDSCCIKCVGASEGLYDEEEIIVILPDGEELSLEDFE